MDNKEKANLLSEFPVHTYEEWKEAAVKLLKGRSFEKTLITPTYEGFDLQPIYTKEVLDDLPHVKDLPGTGSRVRGSKAEGYLETSWLVSQELTAPTPVAMNKLVLEELSSGQSELNLWLDKSTRAGIDADDAAAGSVGVCGLSLGSLGDMKQVLDGVQADCISTYIQSGKASPAVYALLVAALKEKGADLNKIKGCIGMDPVGELVEYGELAGGRKEAFCILAGLVEHAAETMPEMQVIDVQGHAYHNGGASSTQEMAVVLATAVTYLKELQARGITPDVVVPRMRLSLSVGGNYFLEIAKIRALRLLWSKVMDAFGVSEQARDVHLHARTGLYNKTVYDPYVNMLRTTTEAFSAVVGGVDSLHVGPFDEVLRESDAFSRRIARNTHSILGEECGMTEVVDPAGGSWAVEALTDKMASEAWKKFQQIEEEGGIVASLEAGKLQASVEEVRLAKVKNIQRRKDVIVGTNSYPNATEELLQAAKVDYAAAAADRKQALADWKGSRDASAVDAAITKLSSISGESKMAALVDAAAVGATVQEMMTALAGEAEVVKAQPIALKRAAEEFEKLRMAAKALTDAGNAPVIHQLNMGPSRRYRIRADWTSAFFQVGGFDVLNQDDYADVPEALGALKDSDAKVAVITSDDDTYAGTAEALAKEITDACPGVTILLAGAPGDNEEAWRAAGVSDFVNVRVNNYTFNRGLLESMGAAL
ncbi:MAG: methylmalonyl-CoA mutase family protein [Puniceicoccaceae bacterium]